MHKPILPVGVVKLPCRKGGGIRPRTETCANWVESIALVPCLHQGNIYITRELGVWRVQKCIPLVGAKTSLTCAGRQTTPSQGRRYRAENGNLRKFGRIHRLGTVCATGQYSYKKTVRGMESSKFYSFSRCKPPS